MSGAVAMLMTGGFNKTVSDHTWFNSSTETIPTGASQVIIEVYGSGGGGSGTVGGGGGGASGYSRKTLALTSTDWGKTFTCTLFNVPGAGTSGGSGTVVNGTYGTSVNMVANGGTGGLNGGTGGAGGTASGGTTNTTGASGINAGAGGAATVGLNGLAQGAGGDGNGSGGVGSGGFARFTYS